MKMNYEESLAWLTAAASFGIKPGLERIEALLAGLGNPEKSFRSIHVTGTNGKGSVVAMIDSVLRQAGISVGRYTSPHLHDYTERITVNGADISREDFARYLNEVRIVAETLPESGIEKPTEFEILTAAAFLCFRDKNCEYAVVEVGMGGLLDSTNVIIPEVSVITNVSIDHTAYCGDTVKEIATHKAGIIKPEVPVVTAAGGEALQVIKKAARAKKSRIYYWERDFSVKQRSPGKMGQIITLKRKDWPDAMLFVPFFGIHQAVNASVAAMALTVLMKKEPRITEDHLREGLACAKWPGRFEVYDDEVPIILDGAHNVDGAAALAMVLKEQYPKTKRIFVFASLRDKDLGGIVGELFQPEDTVIAVPAPTERSRKPEEIAQSMPCTAMTAEDVIAGIKKARSLATPETVICVCGSLYILGDARAFLNEEKVK